MTAPPDEPPDAVCLAFHDFDVAGESDGRVDLDDFGGLLNCFRGSGQTPPPECFRPAPAGEVPGSGSFALHGSMVDVLSGGRGPGDELALQYSRARYFDLKHGRFLQRDPKGYIDGANLYEAFASNPARFVDPYGLFGLERGHQRAFPRTGEYYQPWDMLPQIAGDPEIHAQFERGRMLRRQLAEGQCEGYRWMLVADACDFAPSVIPGVNDGVDWMALTTGVDPVTDEELAYWERGFYAGGLLFGSGRWYKEGFERVRGVAGPGARRAWNAVSHKADNAWKVASHKVSEGWDWVKRKVLRRGGDKIDDVVRYGPHVQGPLPAQIAGAFRGGCYSENVLQSETVLYRVWGGKAAEIGPWWSRTPPRGPLQTQIDLGLRPEWGNTMENVAQIRVPGGTTIYEGFAAPQGSALLGGGNQVYIPNVDPAWVVKP